MKSLLLAFLFISMVSGENLQEWQQYQTGLSHLLQMSSQSSDSIPQKTPTLTNNLDLLNSLSLMPTNPGLDLLNHGLGFGMAVLRGLGMIMQNNERNQLAQ